MWKTLYVVAILQVFQVSGQPYIRIKRVSSSDMAAGGSFSTSSSSSSSGGGGDLNFPHQAVFPPPPINFTPTNPLEFHRAMIDYLQRLQEHHQAVIQRIAAMQGAGYGPNSASASGYITPEGGYGLAEVSPGQNGGVDLNTRFGNGPRLTSGGKFPPLSSGGTGGGIFTSSSSSSETKNGVTNTKKMSSVGVLDANGNIVKYFNAHQP